MVQYYPSDVAQGLRHRPKSHDLVDHATREPIEHLYEKNDVDSSAKDLWCKLVSGNQP